MPPGACLTEGPDILAAAVARATAAYLSLSPAADTPGGGDNQRRERLPLQPEPPALLAGFALTCATLALLLAARCCRGQRGLAQACRRQEAPKAAQLTNNTNKNKSANARAAHDDKDVIKVTFAQCYQSRAATTSEKENNDACSDQLTVSQQVGQAWRSRVALERISHMALVRDRAIKAVCCGCVDGDGNRTKFKSWLRLNSIYTRPRAAGSTETFRSINGARMLASTHIVLGHLYQMNALPGGGYVFAWGFTWVPWFFMLSGFVLTHARLSSMDPQRRESALLFVRKRTANVYPLYAVGLGLALVVDWCRGKALPAWYELVAQAFFVQSWLPWLPERTVQVHCWFLSAMLPYWLLYDPFLHRVVLRITTLRSAALTLLLLALPPCLALLLPASLPGGDPQWYATHRTGALQDGTDYAVVLLKFHPACYAHVFLFGMVLAQLRFLLDRAVHTQHGDSQVAKTAEPGVNWVGCSEQRMSGILLRLSRCGASLGYLGLLCVFSVAELRPTSWKISARLSVLMPLQGLVLLGLSPVSPTTLPAASPAGGGETRTGDMGDSSRCSEIGGSSQESIQTIGPAKRGPSLREPDRVEQPLQAPGLRDPVEWLFSHAPLAWGNLSYAQYVLQFVAYALWPSQALGTGQALLFFAFLLALSQVAVVFITRPASAWWARGRPARVAALPCFVALVGAVLCSINRELEVITASAVDGCGRPTRPVALPPAYVHVAAQARDVRLNWTALAADFDEPRALINPSLLWSSGHLVRAARAHAVTCAANRSFTYNGVAGTELTTTWHSDIALDGGAVITSREQDGASRQREVDVDGGIAAWSTWDVGRWGLDGSGPLRRLALLRDDGAPWGALCEGQASWEPSNATSLRTRVTGPEDPKLFKLPANFGTQGAAGLGRVGLAISSLAPRREGVECPMVAGGQAQYNMFQVAGGLSRPAEGSGTYSAQANGLPCGNEATHEKNWIAMPRGETLHYVYSIFPHVVKTVDAAGTSNRTHNHLHPSYPHPNHLHPSYPHPHPHPTPSQVNAAGTSLPYP